jgi:hypothetical protein
MTYWSNLRDIAMSDDGSRMAVVDYSGNLYTSSDAYSWNSASSYDDDTNMQDWQAIAMSADGGTIVAVATANSNGEGGVYLSTDWGQNWHSVVFGGSASLNLVDVAVAGSGSRLSAVANGGQGGQVWISADAGTTWAPAPTTPAGIAPAPTVSPTPAPTPTPTPAPIASRTASYTYSYSMSYADSQSSTPQAADQKEQAFSLCAGTVEGQLEILGGSQRVYPTPAPSSGSVPTRSPTPTRTIAPWL